MINHGYAPPEFLHFSTIPLPKGARADLSNSDMYRSIAISSILSKIFNNVIIERQQDFLIYCYLMHPKLLKKFHIKNYLNCDCLAMCVQKL